MKNIVIVIVIFIVTLFACKQKTANENTKLKMLLSYYKDTTFTEFFIYPDYNFTYSDSNYLFIGTQIDSTIINTLIKPILYDMSWKEGFYGIYSFQINEDFIGLLTRTPGEYSSSVISLWVYDTKRDTIANEIKLADIYGDGGAHEAINSYIFFDKEKKLNVLTYDYYSYDHSNDDTTDTTVEEHRNYYLIKVNPYSLDTLTTDSSILCKAFNSQLKKMAKE